MIQIAIVFFISASNAWCHLHLALMAKPIRLAAGSKKEQDVAALSTGLRYRTGVQMDMYLSEIGRANC
jgi:hypothetical protein